MELGQCEHLLLQRENGFLSIYFDRPHVRNAMNLEMVRELSRVLMAVSESDEIRAVILRGSGGHFCAGGDIKDMAAAADRSRHAEMGADEDPFFELNRAFGDLLCLTDRLPQVVIAVLEGNVLGGGFGLACVSDVALCHVEARFGLPETGLGIPPAQIAPFVVRRIGLTQARYLALTGLRFRGREALRLGLVHRVASDEAGLKAELEAVCEGIRHCGPQANSVTKRLMLQVGQVPLETLLDDAARAFSSCIRGEEGQEGTRAFSQKRKPIWAEPPPSS
ncbi:Enoyl-CoA hydratase/isomerase family protein [Sulfidibacter corallicola]|uniref:Enoyl-CoA hydratase/isomerase family protein n=1 Tax=Sulfidibacter corallicola TaxID=2818388 RepID=A0A8A4TLX5_SULCO|nr:enoyl-CoA hydratase-related protein [Sulfidibacter corallicola]QTD49881.1 enoyl-CoA hydratase/isomerase family protein [Sulfidibacter corallicola]